MNVLALGLVCSVPSVASAERVPLGRRRQACQLPTVLCPVARSALFFPPHPCVSPLPLLTVSCASHRGQALGPCKVPNWALRSWALPPSLLFPVSLVKLLPDQGKETESWSLCVFPHLANQPEDMHFPNPEPLTSTASLPRNGALGASPRGPPGLPHSKLWSVKEAFAYNLNIWIMGKSGVFSDKDGLSVFTCCEEIKHKRPVTVPGVMAHLSSQYSGGGD